MTYLDALGLKEPPFSKEIADADLWLPTSKQLVADGLLDALTERASVLLVGEPGVGKTCVLRALRHRVTTAGYRLTYSHNATLGRRDFYRQLCLALGLAPAATAGNFFYAVSSHVEELSRERVHPVRCVSTIPRRPLSKFTEQRLARARFDRRPRSGPPGVG